MKNEMKNETKYSMNVIDMHCDTLMKAMLFTGIDADLYDHPSTMLDLKRMREGGYLAQFFAVFLVPEDGCRQWYHLEPMSDETLIRGCVHILEKNLEKHGDIIGRALTAEDVSVNEKLGKMSAVLTMEDGKDVQGDMDRLKAFYDMGFRAMTLTWNARNCFGSPHSKDPHIMREGLTDFGKEAVAYMQELGMIVDVSHLSDGGFYDVAAICKKPFVATHSNCRELSPHTRNLTDPMIRVLAEHGGVTGLNFGAEFLNRDISNPASRVEEMVRMVEHMKQVGGIDVIGIGTDFDGIDGEFEIPDCAGMPLLVDGLKKHGFTESELDKIFHGNVLRVMKDTL